jgi:hypothetical protein
MKHVFACAAAVGLCAACTVEVTDRTSSPFYYHPPINPQTFRVEVQSDTTVRGVEFMSPGAGVAPMTPVGGDIYETTVPVPVCASAIEFSVDVTTQRILSDRTQTFPEAGRYTHQVVELPNECNEFADTFGQTFVVDKRRDFVDSAPGDGVCRGDFVGPNGAETGCSLRAAVMEANASPGHDLIRLSDTRHRLTLNGSEDATAVNERIRDLDITESVTIEGPSRRDTHLGVILRRSGNRDDDLTDNDANFGFARIDGNDEQRIFHVTGPGVVLRLRNLAILHGNEAGAGGGVLNEGTLTLERVAFAENRAESVVGGGFGGGAVQNDGVLVGEDVAFTQNIVGGSNPAGGALHNTGEMTLRRVLIAYNDARFGAGLMNLGGTSMIENATVYNNRWTGAGRTPPVTVFRTQSGGEMWLSFATLSDHSLDTRTLLSAVFPSTIRVRNTLMVDNIANLCAGNILSYGGNVIEGVCRFARGSAPLAPDHEDVGFVSGTSSLIDRGGFLPVVEIGSYEFDARDLGYAPPFPFTDQRGVGFARRVDGNGDGEVRPDPGAFEYTP